jgi:hypothetical protein
MLMQTLRVILVRRRTTFLVDVLGFLVLVVVLVFLFLAGFLLLDFPFDLGFEEELFAMFL